MRQSWDRSRVIAVLAAVKDAGISVPKMSRTSGVTRSTIYRWMAGEVQPDYGKVYSLAYAVHPRYPGLARDLVEASGYVWAEPRDAPPSDVLADELGQDTADRVRRELAKRGEAGRTVLAEFERVLSSPGAAEEAQSEPDRAVS